MDLDLEWCPRISGNGPRWQSCLAGWSVNAKSSAAGQPTAISYHLKIPPNHESAVNTMAVDDDAQQQPRNAAANGGHQDPADHDEHGLLVTLRADLSDEDSTPWPSPSRRCLGSSQSNATSQTRAAAPRWNSTIPGGGRASSTS